MKNKRFLFGMLVMVLGIVLMGCSEEERSFDVSIIIKNETSDKTIDGYLFSGYQLDSWNRIDTNGVISIAPGETSTSLGPFTTYESNRGGRDFDFFITVVGGSKTYNGTHDAMYSYSEGNESPPSKLTLIYKERYYEYVYQGQTYSGWELGLGLD